MIASATFKTLLYASIIFLTLLISSCQDHDNSALKPGHSLPLQAAHSVDTSFACQSTDINGCARIINKKEFFAGEKIDFLIEYTVGLAGISVGGGISVGIHHAARWNTQTTSMSNENFVAIRSDIPENFAFKRFNNAPAGMFLTTTPGLRSNAIFHKVLVATVKKTP